MWCDGCSAPSLHINKVKWKWIQKEKKENQYMKKKNENLLKIIPFFLLW